MPTDSMNRSRRSGRLERHGWHVSNSMPTTWNRTARWSIRSLPSTARSTPRCWRSAILGDQSRAETDAAHAVAVVHTDYVAQVSLLTHLAAAMRRAGCGESWWCSPRWPASGCVAPTMCTARRRRAWTASPAGWPTRCTGPAFACAGARPGFVIGRMTQGMTPAPLSSTPAQVAEATARALARGRRIVWVPWALRPAVSVMRLLPQFVWRRMPR